jgi:hypothetical protein
MKLSDLRPCDSCGGPISPQFHVVRYSIALIKPQANQVAAMTLYFGSLALGELFSPDDNVVTVAMDEDEFKEIMIELFICQRCYLEGQINLAFLAEKRLGEIQKRGDIER